MSQHLNYLLLVDSINQAIANPTSYHHWEQIIELIDLPSNHSIRDTAIQQIAHGIEVSGVSGFYRSIFLAHANNDHSQLNEAGNVLLNLRPVQLDRIMTYVNFTWSLLVQSGQCAADLNLAVEEKHIPELIKLAGIKTQKNSTLKKREILDLKKIAIYTPQLINRRHPPTVLTIEYAKLLRELGYDVQIFTCQEQLIQHSEQYLSNDCRMLDAPFDEDLLIDLPPEKRPRISRAHHNFSLELRFSGMLDIIGEFDPDLCLFIGAFSPIISSIYMNRPILSLNIMAMPPWSECDVWLSAKNRLEEFIPADIPTTPKGVPYYHPYRVQRKTDQGSFDRDQLLIPKGAILLVTVGYRLHQEISGPWAQEMVNLCENFPEIVWLLIGSGENKPPALIKINDTQLRNLPHQDELGAIYRGCDIYLNPPRVGGGFSVSEAMAEGLPTLAFQNTDGGDKLGDLAASSMMSYFEELTSLITNKAARAEKSEQLKQIFREKLDLRESGTSLKKACELTVHQFNRRA